jgi:hypothetical protein
LQYWASYPADHEQNDYGAIFARRRGAPLATAQLKRSTKVATTASGEEVPGARTCGGDVDDVLGAASIACRATTKRLLKHPSANE